MIIEKTIVVGGARVRVVEAGPAHGEPVLCVHGVGGWAENWRETLEMLARNGYHAYACDLPGFGQSDRGTFTYFEGDVPGYASVVVGVIDALGYAQVHLIGHSLGGAIAYLTAVCAPERIRSLVLVAPGGVGEDLPLSLRLPALPLVGWLLRRRPREGARAGLASCFRDPRRIPPQLLAECDRYAPRSLEEAGRVLRAGVTIRGVKRSLRERWLALAGRYTGPALIVWGEDDMVLPARHARIAKDLFPQAEIRTIPDAGHLVMVEQPQAFAGAVLPFLRSRSTEAAAAHN